MSLDYCRDGHADVVSFLFVPSHLDLRSTTTNARARVSLRCGFRRGRVQAEAVDWRLGRVAPIRVGMVRNPAIWEEESLLLWIQTKPNQTKRISIGGQPTHRIQAMEPGDGPRTTRDVNFEDKDGRGRHARSKRDRFDRKRPSLHPSSNGRKEPWEGERTNVPCTSLRTTTVNNVPQDLCLPIHAKNVTTHRRTYTSISSASKTYPSFNARNKRRKSMPFTTVDEGCAKQ